MFSANKCGDDALVGMEGKIIVKLDVPGEKFALAECPIRGQVGHTQLLVSETDLKLHAGKAEILVLRNAGVVPLDLTILATFVKSSDTEPALSIEPNKFVINPGMEIPICVTWNPQSGAESTIVHRLDNRVL